MVQELLRWETDTHPQTVTTDDIPPLLDCRYVDVAAGSEVKGEFNLEKYMA